MVISPVSKILIQRADKLGDVILSLPVVDALKAQYPDAEIHFLTSSVGALIIDTYPLISKTICCAQQGNTIAELPALIDEVKSENYSHYISLWNHSAFARLGYLCGIPCRIGDATDFRLKRYYTHPVRQTWEDFSRHQVEFNKELLAPFGISPQLMPSQLPVPDSAKQSAGQLLADLDPQLKTVFIFAVTGGTNYPIPYEPLQQFIQDLLATKTYAVILAGQSQEQTALTKLKKSGLVNVINKTTFPELMALIDQSDFYVGPDTGPTHLASFMNKPILFFSSVKPNPPVRWGPLADHFVCIRKEYVCPFLCVKKCHPDSCFSFVTSELLMSSFEKLVSHTLFEAPMVTKRAHLLASVRVLFVTRSVHEYNQLFPLIQSLREQGLMIFPYLIRGWSLIRLVYVIRLVIKHNINVLQGDWPSWVTRTVRFFMGAIAVYVPPIVVPISFSSILTVDDYLDAYIQVWKKKS